MLILAFHSHLQRIPLNHGKLNHNKRCDPNLTSVRTPPPATLQTGWRTMLKKRNLSTTFTLSPTPQNTKHDPESRTYLNPNKYKGIPRAYNGHL